MNHIAPKYYDYNGGFASVTICEDCERTALYEDQHVVSPCPDCGGAIQENYVGKWCKPIYSGIWPFRKKLTCGFWVSREGKILKLHRWTKV